MSHPDDQGSNLEEVFIRELFIIFIYFFYAVGMSIDDVRGVWCGLSIEYSIIFFERVEMGLFFQEFEKDYALRGCQQWQSSDG